MCATACIAMIRKWAVMLVGLPIVEVILGLYWLRKVFFNVPINGEWGEYELHAYRRDANGKLVRKGPNGWN